MPRSRLQSEVVGAVGTKYLQAHDKQKGGCSEDEKQPQDVIKRVYTRSHMVVPLVTI
jgi:hypothetical protein